MDLRDYRAEAGVMDAPWWTGDEPDPHPEGRYEPPDAPRFCDACHGDCHIGTVTLPFGTYCSRACADLEQGKFDERMKRRGFQIVQPDLLAHASGE